MDYETDIAINPRDALDLLSKTDSNNVVQNGKAN
jgi:hypothetical protein